MEEADLGMEFECGEYRCRNMFWEFVYIVGIPAAVLVIMVLSACLLACLGICKRKRKLSPEDQTLLLRYQSIRHASLSLRNLSQHRDTPLVSCSENKEGRPVSMTLDSGHRYRRGTRGTASAPGTLQRDRQNRPARDRSSDILPSQYSVPPSFPSDSNINREATQGSGVEYAEVQHGITTATSSSSQQLT